MHGEVRASAQMEVGPLVIVGGDPSEPLATTTPGALQDSALGRQ